MLKRLHHVAIAVNDLDESVSLYERILGIKPSSIEDVPSQKLRAAVFEVGKEAEVEIELIQPTEPDSVVARFLRTHGQGLHHICFEVEEVDEELRELLENGIELINRQGRTGISGRIGFLHPESTHGVLIELIQRETPREEKHL